MVSGCVDQQLIPVERPASGGSAAGGAATGGESNTTGGPPGGGSSNNTGLGGAFGSGGVFGMGGQDGNCTARFADTCGDFGACCSRGLDCVGGKCCKEPKQGCSNNSECCNGSCTNNTCCAGVNQNCTSNFDCCSSQCVNGVCAGTVGQCYVADYSQRCSPGACCSGKCDFYEGGAFKVCQAIDGCKPVGERCQHYYDCCSDICDEKTWRCAYAYPPFCQKAGDTCGDDAVSDQPCCAQLTCIEGTDRVHRCTQVPRDAGQRCRFSADCRPIGKETSGHCVAFESAPARFEQNGNYGICGVCGEAGISCKVDLDCCTGYNCANHDVLTGFGTCEPLGN